MTQELLAIIISGVISLIIGMLLGRYGLMRNITAFVDGKVQQINTQAQIALTREQTDHQAVTSLHSQISSLIDLLSKQLVQQAQLESEKITAQNSLSLAIRDATEEMRSNQRISATNIENILSIYGRSMDKVELGFRSVSDEMLLTNSSFTRITNHMSSEMAVTRSMFDTIRNDVSALRNTAALSQENLDELLEIFVEVRNTILKALRFNKTAIIRPRSDNRFTPIPSDLLIKKFEVRGENKPDPSQEAKPAKTDEIQLDNAILPAEEQKHETDSP